MEGGRRMRTKGLDRMAYLSAVLGMFLSACLVVQPTPTERPTPPRTGGGACAGIRIAFFPGGYPGCPYSTVVRTGAATAASDLGAEVEYVFSHWDPETLVQQFQDVVATEPDGIAVIGLPGDDALAAAIDEARAKGIVVTSQGIVLPACEAKYRSEGFGYVGQDAYASGLMLGEAAIDRAGFGTGDRALVWGFLSDPGFAARTKGVLDALETAGMIVDYIEIDPATDAEYEAGIPIFTEYVASHPDVKLVCTDHEGLTKILPALLTAAGREPDDIYAIGFGLTTATVQAIREGWADLVHDQEPFLQGYLPILQICLAKRYQFSGMHISTEGGLVHSGNIEGLAPLVERQFR
jgi:simple sugar transport system substrate-binding protein